MIATCPLCGEQHEATHLGGLDMLACPHVPEHVGAVLVGASLPEARPEWTAAVFAQWMPGTRSVAFADCQRCGAPAHPIRGYCGRFCEEATAYDAEQRALLAEHTIVCSRPGYSVRIENLV